MNKADQYFLQDIQFMMMYHQSKFDCKKRSSLKDVTETALFRLYKPSL